VQDLSFFPLGRPATFSFMEYGVFQTTIDEVNCLIMFDQVLFLLIRAEFSAAKMRAERLLVCDP
jgi:hypothetical protein